MVTKRASVRKSRISESKEGTNMVEAITSAQEAMLAARSELLRDFPDGPVVKTLHFQCRGHRFIPS